MGVTYPGGTGEYRAVRNRWLAAEVELRRAMDRVAEPRRVAAERCHPGGLRLRRGIPRRGARPDPDVGPLRGGEALARRLQLHVPPGPSRRGPRAQGGRAALLPLIQGSCPSCVALIDQLEGAAEHVAPHVNLAVAARAPLRWCSTSPSARVAPDQDPLDGGHHLQHRLPTWSAPRDSPAGPQCLQPGRGHHPAFLGLRAVLRAHRTGQETRHVGTLGRSGTCWTARGKAGRRAGMSSWLTGRDGEPSGAAGALPSPSRLGGAPHPGLGGETTSRGRLPLRALIDRSLLDDGLGVRPPSLRRAPARTKDPGDRSLGPSGPPSGTRRPPWWTCPNRSGALAGGWEWQHPRRICGVTTIVSRQFRMKCSFQH